jgi:hypothetical protein
MELVAPCVRAYFQRELQVGAEVVPRVLHIAELGVKSRKWCEAGFGLPLGSRRNKPLATASV